VDHIARHSVSPDEVEEIFVDRPMFRKTKEKRYLNFGRTLDGQYLFVVFILMPKGRVRTITARNMDSDEKRLYRKWIGGKRQ
jgi:uncharacterized DUF497 family protein